MTEVKPECQLTGTDGNVFALGGTVIGALKRAGLSNEAKEFRSRLLKCHSYDEALTLMGEYVEVR